MANLKKNFNKRRYDSRNKTNQNNKPKIANNIEERYNQQKRQKIKKNKKREKR